MEADLNAVTGYCPLYERRTPPEMFMILFVVHLTVMSGFVYLRHLRGEKQNIYFYLFVIVCPLSGTALLLIPVIALLVQAVVCRGDRTSLRRSGDILVGRLPSDHDDSLLHDRKKEYIPITEFQRSRRASFLIPLALLCQCTISIWLFARRVDRGSDVLYDHRIFLLGILGVIISTMTLVHLLVQPHTPSQIAREQFPEGIKWLSELNSLRLSGLIEGEHYFHGMIVYGLSALSFIMFIPRELAGDPLGDPEKILDFSWKGLRLYLVFHAFVILPGVLWFSYHWSKPKVTAKDRDSLAFAFSITAMLFAEALMVLMVFGGFFGPLEGLWQLVKLFLPPKYVEIHDRTSSNHTHQPDSIPDWNRIGAFANLPTTSPCPKAWKDPIANYVRWIV